MTTETNYVAILECISKISSEAEDPSQQGGALLDQQEMKIIFGMMPPILKYVFFDSGPLDSTFILGFIPIC